MTDRTTGPRTEPRFRHDDLGTPERLWAGEPAFDGLPRIDLGAWPGLRRVLVVAAHPDDETLGAAGLVRAAADAGLGVEVAAATSGEGSHPGSRTHDRARLARVRDVELEAAVGVLAPACRVHRLGLPDGGLADREDELAERLSGLLGEGASTLVVAPWRSDGHPDHEAAGRAAARAARDGGAPLLEYPVWLWHWGSEDDVPWDDAVRLDLDRDARTAKTAAIAAHRSQSEALSPEPGDEPVLLPHTLEHFARAFEVFLAGAEARGVVALEDLHRRERDPWGVGEGWYERRKRALTLASLPRERFARGLEVGCSVGALAADLATRCDRLVGLDASASALAEARARVGGLGTVELAHLHVPRQWPQGRFDLVVLSEVGYFCERDQLAGLVERAVGSLTDDGVLLACHWRHPVTGWPLDGDEVHAVLGGHPGLEVLARHVEEDFALDVLVPPPATSVARRSGLLGG